MLRNERGYFLQSYELMPLLGFRRGQHLPPEGFDIKVINGVWFKCEPTQPHSGKKHRIFYGCEACCDWIPFGRAGQHIRGRQHKLNQEIRFGRP